MVSWSRPLLPLEVLEYCIDSIATSSPEGRRSLACFSLSCKSLTVVAQRRLFSEVHVSLTLFIGHDDIQLPGEHHAKSCQLIDLLKSAPHIASYVRLLVGRLIMQHADADGLPTAPQSGQSSLLSDFPLYVITGLLPNLEKFALSSPGSFLGCEWFDSVFTDFLLGLAGRLPAIDLSPILHLPMSFFSNCGNLTNVSVTDLSMELVSPSETKARLRSLRAVNFALSPGPDVPEETLPMMSSWFEHPNCPFDLSELVSLTVGDAHPPSIDRLLKLCPDLQRLNLTIGYSTLQASYGSDNPTELPAAAPEELPALRILKDLRHLVLHREIFGDSECQQDIFSTNLPLVSTVLKHLPSSAQGIKVTIITRICHIPIEQLGSIARSNFLFRSFNDDNLISNYATLDLVFESMRLEGAINVMEPAFVEMLDKNENLRKLRDRRVLSYFFVTY